MKRCLAFFMILGLFAQVLNAQTGGESAFAYLKVPASPLATAMGGAGISYGPNLGLAIRNPALLDSALDRTLELNYQKYVTDIQFTQMSYAHSFYPKTLTAFDFAYMNYGSFQGMDEQGEETGKFYASDFKLGGHLSYRLTDRVQIGASLLLLYSQYERYSSTAIASHWSAVYFDPVNQFRTSLVFRNLGCMLSRYASSYEHLPFEIEWAFVKKLDKAPFAFSVALHDLQNWKIYRSPEAEEDILTGETRTESSWTKAGKEVLSHLALGVEMKPSKVLSLMAGYNFRRQNQLGVDAGGEMTGFSFGAGICIRNVQLQYAWAPMHLAGSVHHVGLSFNFK